MFSDQFEMLFLILHVWSSGVNRKWQVKVTDFYFGLVLGLRCNHFVFQDRENAQSSCAGLFIGSHLGFDWPGVWVHIDIASPVHAVSTFFNFAVGTLIGLHWGESSHHYDSELIFLFVLFYFIYI